MEFPTDDHEHAFYKLDSLLQIICSVFEYYAFEYGLSMALIDIDYDLDLVVLWVAKADESIGQELCAKVNKRFASKKGFDVLTQDRKDSELFYAKMDGQPIDYKSKTLDS